MRVSAGKVKRFVFTEDKPKENKPDDGEFFRFAWRVSEALYRTDFTKVQHRLIHYIIRKTWGWNRKTIIFNLKKAAEEMGLPKPHVSRAYHQLIKADVFKTDRGEIGLNKYFETWNLEFLKESIADETRRRKSNVTDAVTDGERYGCGNDSVTDPVTTVTDAVTETGRKSSNEADSSNPYRHSSIDTPLIDKTTTTEQVDSFDEHLAILQSVKGYPFDEDSDWVMLKTLADLFQKVDLLSELKGWSIYKMDQPIKKGDNPRSQIRNWMKKAANPPAWKKDNAPPRRTAKEVMDDLERWAAE